ncbi:MAG: phosphoribosylanthranilate isomerase [Clostridium sp.]
MTRVKLCGMMRPEDIQAVNEIKPEYIGFVFAKKSRRYVSKEQAKMLKEMLDPAVKAVGVFVNEPVENVADLLNEGIVDMAQLHGVEDEAYICRLRELTGRGEDTFIIKAVQVKSEADVKAGEQSGADLVLFDAGAGDGKVFNWKLLENVKRPYFSGWWAGSGECEGCGGKAATIWSGCEFWD